MTKERLKQIFDKTEAEWNGDNAFQGLQILSKYFDNLIIAAEHDIIYGPGITDEFLEQFTEEDAVALRKLNWMLEYDEQFACFV